MENKNDNKVKESKRQCDGRNASLKSNNGTTLRTLTIPNKKKRTRIIKRVDWEIALEDEW